MQVWILTSAIASILVNSLAAIAQPPLELPPLTGPFQTGRVKTEWVDLTREEAFTPAPNDHRTIGVQIWYPRQNGIKASPPPYLEGVSDQDLFNANVPKAIISALRSIPTRSISNASIFPDQTKYPVVFFSPGYGGNLPRTHLTQIEELASHGYIVIGMIHLDPDQKITNKVIKAALKERVADIQFILNRLPNLTENDLEGVNLSDRMDLQNIGILGHSMGGTTAGEIILVDSRFDAGISLDGQFSQQVVKQGLNQPFMLINQYSMSVREPTQEKVYRRLKKSAYSVSLKGAAHDAFTDIPYLASLFPQYDFNSLLSPLFSTPSEPKPQRMDANLTLKYINDYSVAFFDQHLKSQDSPLLRERASPASVIYKFRLGTE